MKKSFKIIKYLTVSFLISVISTVIGQKNSDKNYFMDISLAHADIPFSGGGGGDSGGATDSGATDSGADGGDGVDGTGSDGGASGTDASAYLDEKSETLAMTEQFFLKTNI
jgi:hypothetical protein